MPYREPAEPQALSHSARVVRELQRNDAVIRALRDRLEQPAPRRAPRAGSAMEPLARQDPLAGPLEARWPEQMSWSWWRVAGWILLTAVAVVGLLSLAVGMTGALAGTYNQAAITLIVVVAMLYALLLGFIVFKALSRSRQRKRARAANLGAVPG